MARRHSDREDLMREATALSRRIEVRLPGEQEPVVAGFREQGAISIYFGQDPVFHFDNDGGLRRAFHSGDLYRTQGTTLARLRRVRSPGSTELVRYDLTDAELRDFLARMDERLSRLQAAIASGQATVLRLVPAADAAVFPDLFATLARILCLEERLGSPFAGKS